MNSPNAGFYFRKLRHGNMRKCLILLVFFGLMLSVTGQNQIISTYREAGQLPFIEFRSNPKQSYGFDSFRYPEWEDKYDLWNLPLSGNYYIPYKSVGFRAKDLVDAILVNPVDFNPGKLSFRINDTLKTGLKYVFRNDSTITVQLPEQEESYVLKAYYDSTIIGRLRVNVYPKETEKLILIPLVPRTFSKDSVQIYLNTVFKPANLSFEVEIGPCFIHSDFDSTILFDNPPQGFDHYTHQMRSLRDTWFDLNPTAEKKANYIFVISGFVDPHIKSFMPRNKAMGFLKDEADSVFYLQLAKSLGRGIGFLQESWADQGPPAGSTNNLMDTLGRIHLTHFQWDQLRHGTGSYSFFDADEDVRTNNGRVAYYFWEEDENGYIRTEEGNLLSAIKRPFKKNYLSYHLDIQDLLFKPLFSIGQYFVCWWHIIASVCILLLVWIGNRQLRSRFEKKEGKVRIWELLLKRGVSLVGLTLIVFVFFFINAELDKYEVTSGYLEELKGTEYPQAYRYILYNKNLKRANEEEMSSEILLKRGENWFMKRRKKVLYFEAHKDSTGKWNKYKLKSENDSLIVVTFQYKEPASSHYFVVNYMDENGYYDHQKVFNHTGFNITDRLIPDEDPAKRILVFVNGYRPTSIGRTFEENFADIRKNGLEFPDSRNLVYNFDRYDYWRPWQEFDLVMQKRINPSETFYADGHFSVATSNHRSLLNFTSLANKYPKRCSNPEHHICQYTDAGGSRWFGSTKRETATLLPDNANKSGFNKRKENGKIAGLNLLQLLNEVPNKSFNDTLFIVAHSMGFAYTLGMLEELRGKINFGEFYIIAPENAESGKVYLEEWQKVWQYGCNHERWKSSAPCMLDGVAPQTKVDGLHDTQRVYIPDTLYKRHGFFNSHFIGYYTWILDIPEDQPGYMKQR